MNKKGVTLMELLAYLALIGIIVTLLTSTMSYAVRSYDIVNGQGALYTEANYIMSNLMTQANVYNPDSIKKCDEESNKCIELVKELNRTIDVNLGIYKEEIINESVQIRLVSNEKYPDVYDIYIGNMKLNNKGYAFSSISVVDYQCFDTNISLNTCQKFVVSLKFSMYRINKNGERISKDYQFENQFSF